MVRMRLLTFLGLSLAVVAHAADSKPAWQRLLGGEDAKKAAGLQQRIEKLEAADKYAEAIKLSEELLALRTKVQGAEHWETVNQKWALAVLQKVAALPAEQRAGWRKAVRGAAEADSLEQKAQYGKALPLRQERLKWCRHVLGEDHLHTASGYNNLADNLQYQGKYGEAGPLYHKALDICRKTLGEDHPDTALSYHNVAVNLDAQGKHREAWPLNHKALDIRRQVLGEEHSDTAISYNNLAYSLNEQGKYAEAGPLLQKALDIYRQTLGEQHRYTATTYHNLAFNLARQGKYAEALPLNQKALDICRKALGEEHPDNAHSYNSIADNLSAQGKYAEAGPLFQKALDIRRKTLGEEHPDTAESYSNIAANLQSQGKYAEAGPLFQKALDIRRKTLGEEHPLTVTSYNNVAANLHAQGKYVEAGPLLQKALDIYRKALGEEHPYTAISYDNIASRLRDQGKYAEAEPLLQKALGICRKARGEQHPDTARCYHEIAANLWFQGKHAAALAPLEASARCYEAARLGVAAAGLERAAFGAKRSPYAFLTAAYRHAGRAADAWAALEADLARGLLDDMALRRGAGLTPTERRQRDELLERRASLEARVLALISRAKRTAAEDVELKQILEQRQELDKSLAELAVAVSRREVDALDRLQAALPADTAFLAWVDVSGKSVQEHWGCVVRPKGEPRWERLPGSAADGKWTPEDDQLPRQFRQALAKSAPADSTDALAKKLYIQRLAPLAKHLAGVKRLFVAPVNRMAGIPVEALTDQYTVSYTPSGTYLARLKDRPPPRGTRLLAVGDPLFPATKAAKPPAALPPGGLLIVQVVPGGNAAQARLQAGDVLVAYAGEDLTSLEQLAKLLAAKAKEKSVVVKVWREGQDKLAERELAAGRLGVALAREPARQAITARRQTDQMLAQLTRGDTFAELPGTQVEIARVATLFDAKSVTALTRAQASEQQLDQLRRGGKLKQFRYLHLATHGQANNVRAFDSALILTKPAKLPEPRVGEPYLDGRLTAAEVLEYWQLDAELVTLSACDSGLGRQGGGDGLLGFAQAFLLAGSRSVCLSLWQVDDTATALLMDRFYRNLLGKREDGAKPMGKAAALREAKQWLRNVPASEALQRLGVISEGVVRGQRPAREEMRGVPKPKDAAGDYKPYAHPRYWSAFILLGEPE
jgi:CHAT domain-containing protein/tetratricopeptide (TPR) repeat protein